MHFITVGRENSGPIRICYEDRGSGAPVVLVHGYLLDGHSWEKQEAALLDAGTRVITYDRRGFGSSSRPSVGYDYDTLAADLNALLSELDLHDVTLVGFSAGSGEVTRYLAAYGSGRVRGAALLAPLPPFLLRTADNPEGIDRSVFDEFMADISADRPAATKTFLDRFYNIDLLGGSHVEDFRGDLPRIDVPVLVVQGSQDRILPPEATGDRLPALIRNVRRVVIQGGPNAIIWTHADQVNRALLDFIVTGAS